MRILLIHNHYKQVGGEDTVFFAEAALLEQHGHEVERLTFSNDAVNSFSEKLGAALGVVYNVQSARIIERKILSFKPEVIHVHNFFPLVSPAVFYVADKYRIPIVMTLHNYRLICPSALLHYDGRVQTENIAKIFSLSAINKKVYRGSRFQTASVVLATGVHKVVGTWQQKVDRFIALTPGAAKLFLHSSLRLDPRQLVVKPNFTPDLGEGKADRQDYFLFVGRLTPEKGIETLLRANALHPFKLKIIGDGPLREAVEQHAAEYPQMQYLGFQERERVVQELKSAKALVFPSEWLETFGMTIVEAFSTGTPAIAAKIGGAEQLVQDGVNGFHYTPGRSEELVSKIKRLELDEALRKQLGKNARLSFEQNYTSEVNYNLLYRIYLDVIVEKFRSGTGNGASAESKLR